MDQADITWLRALKIWWSFSWRAFVLMLLVMVPLEAVFFWYAMSNLPKAGGNPADAMRMAGTMAAIWPVFMAALIYGTECIRRPPCYLRGDKRHTHRLASRQPDLACETRWC